MTDKLLKIINHYGVMPQLKYFQSEVFELNEAIIKYENRSLVTKEIDFLNGINSNKRTNGKYEL